MVTVPEPLADEVRDFAASIPTRYVKNDAEGGSGTNGEVHATVKYGLLTEDPDDVEKVVEGVEPFLVTLGDMGVFENKNEGTVVLKLAVESPGLMALNKRVCKMLRHVDTYVDYKPHVTIAYLVWDDNDPRYYKEFFDKTFAGKQFVVDHVKFSTVGGMKYWLPLNGKVAKLARQMAIGNRVASSYRGAR